MSHHTIEDRMHKIIAERFETDPVGVSLETELNSLGDESTVDDFFDDLEFEFSGDIEEEQRGSMSSIGEALAWAKAQPVDEDDEDDEPSNVGGFAWREKISPFQSGFLKISAILGAVMFFFGVQLTVRGNPWGEPLAGVGMFIAASLFWGVKSCYNWVEKNKPTLLQKWGYSSLFWIFVVIAYGLSFLGLGLFFMFLGAQ
jgi:hypothetical protein